MPFIDAHRAAKGVESIFRVLQTSPSCYQILKARAAELPRVAAPTQRDFDLRPHVARVWRADRRMYGAKRRGTRCAAKPERSRAVPPRGRGAPRYCAASCAGDACEQPTCLAAAGLDAAFHSLCGATHEGGDRGVRRQSRRPQPKRPRRNRHRPLQDGGHLL